MKSLLILLFETGDVDCHHYEIMVVIDQVCGSGDFDSIKDGFTSFLEQREDDLDYEDVVQQVMDASIFRWEFVTTRIPECKNSYTIWI